jgi:hypothetical protein
MLTPSCPQPPCRCADGECGRLSQQGQGLIEFAVTLPVLLLVTLVMLEFALFVHAQNVVITACAEGALVAAAADGNVNEGAATAQGLLEAGLGSSAHAVTIQAEDGGPTVSVMARGHLPLLLPGFGGVLPLSARSVMVKEGIRGN